MRMQIFKIFWGWVALALFMSALVAAEIDNKVANRTVETTKVVKVQKKVLVLEFNNINNDKKYSYLGRTIQENVNSSVANLKRFYVIKSSALERLADKESDAAKEYFESALEPENSETPSAKVKKQDVAVRLQADFYIEGSFVAIDGNIQINAMIYATGKEQSLGGAKITGKTDASLFETLDEFAEKLAMSLDKSVPKEKVITKVIYKESEAEKYNTIKVYAAPSLMMPMGFLTDGYGTSLGFQLRGQLENMFVKNLIASLVLGYNSFSIQDNYYDTLTLIPVKLQVGYKLRPLATKKFFILPVLGGGFDFGRFKHVQKEINYFLPAFQADVIFSYDIFQSSSIYLDTGMNIEIDSGLTSFWFVSIGGSYRFD